MTTSEKQYQREASFILTVLLMVTFALGIGAGYLLFDSSPPPPPPPPNLSAPIQLRKPDGSPVELVPYAITRHGQTEWIAPVPDGTQWAISFDGRALQVSYGEFEPPR